MSKIINDERLTQFRAVYGESLAAAMAANPGDYMPGRTANDVADKMLAAIRAKGIGGVSIDGGGFKRAAKRLGVKNTYKAWCAWFEAVAT